MRTPPQYRVGSIRPWPVRPQPREGELLSSWLVRLASANGTTAKVVLAAALGSSPAVALGEDIDRRGLAPQLRDALAQGARVARVRLDTLAVRTLSRFLSVGAPHHAGGGRPKPTSSWLLRSRSTTARRARLSGRIEYCPECLKADREPYFRRIWRLGCFAICPIHYRPYQDRCFNCGLDVACVLGRGTVESLNSVVYCARCGADRREAPSADGVPRVPPSEFELYLTDTLSRFETGYIDVSPDGRGGDSFAVRSSEYFSRLRRRVWEIAETGRDAASVRAALTAEYGGWWIELAEPTWDDHSAPVLTWSAEARRSVLRLAGVTTMLDYFRGEPPDVV